MVLCPSGLLKNQYILDLDNSFNCHIASRIVVLLVETTGNLPPPRRLFLTRCTAKFDGAFVDFENQSPGDNINSSDVVFRQSLMN